MERKLVILKEDLLNRRDKNKLLESEGNYLESQVSYVIDIAINNIQILDTKTKEIKEYPCEDINCISLSMCSRYAGGTGRNGGIRTTINIDVDVVLKDETLLFEIMEARDFPFIISLISKRRRVKRRPFLTYSSGKWSKVLPSKDTYHKQ